VADGIRYAADQGARIVNLSLGGPSSSVILEDAIQYAYNRGALVVAAAGNCAMGGFGCGGTMNPVFYPAAYPTVLAVAATDENDNRASFSEYHPYVAVAAPGMGIYSTLKDGGYGNLNGTSMAAPHVSGLAALIWSLDPSRSRDQVRSVIETTADDLGSPGKDNFFGYGRINARRALAQLTSISLQDSSGRDLAQSGVSFSASAQEGPSPASFNVLVTTQSANVINWTVTVPAEATWLHVVPLTSNITSSGTPGQFALVATRPGSFGAHSTIVTVTGSNSSGAILGTAEVTVQIIYVLEFEKVYMPLIVK
jgi:subtilisin family serine protease